MHQLRNSEKRVEIITVIVCFKKVHFKNLTFPKTPNWLLRLDTFLTPRIDLRSTMYVQLLEITL